MAEVDVAFAVGLDADAGFLGARTAGTFAGAAAPAAWAGRTTNARFLTRDVRYDTRTGVCAVAKVAASLEGSAFVVRVGEVAVGWVAGDCGDGDFLAFEGFGGLFRETIEEGGLRKSGGEQVFDHKLAVDLYVIFSNCVCSRARLGDKTSAHVLFITLVIRHAHLGLFFNTPALLLSSAICAELHSLVTAVSALSSFKKHPSLHHGDSLPQASVVLPLLILDHPGTFVASFKIIVLSFLLEVFASPSSEESV